MVITFLWIIRKNLISKKNLLYQVFLCRKAAIPKVCCSTELNGSVGQYYGFRKVYMNIENSNCSKL
jgi:hypothetical protein